MNPLTELLLPQFVTLVGLLCNWSQEKAAQNGDRDMTFLMWLEHHNFQELSTLIRERSDFAAEIARLQNCDLKKLVAQMDALGSAVAGMSSRLELLAPIAPHTREGHRQVSSAGLGILRRLSQHRDGTLLFDPAALPVYLLLQTSEDDIEIEADEPGLLADDLESLSSYGLLRRLADRNGLMCYAMTRAGNHYAANAT